MNDVSYDDRFTSRERVLHKLTGAAYQATFEKEYDLAVEMCGLAIQFADRTGSNVIQNPEPDNDDQDGIRLPESDTDAFRAVISLLQLHDEGNEWVRRSMVSELYDGDVADALYGLRKRYEIVQWRREDGYIEFRVAPDKREAVVERVLGQ